LRKRQRTATEMWILYLNAVTYTQTDECLRWSYMTNLDQLYCLAQAIHTYHQILFGGSNQEE